MVSNCSAKKLYSWPFFTAFVLRQDPTELPRLPQTCCPLVSTSQLSQAAGVCHIHSLIKYFDKKHPTAIKNNVISNCAQSKRLYFALYWHIFPDVPSQLCKNIFLYFGTSNSTIFELLYTLISFTCFKSSLSNHKMWMAGRFWNGRMNSVVVKW